MSIEGNLKKIKEQLSPACQLIAVSKTHPASAIMEAYNSGHKIFGENKVQEMVEKYEVLPKDIEWHMIGHLQTNKVKFIVPFVKLIHSIDSIKLLAEVDKQAQKVGRIIDCLVQVHIAEEETKFGFSAEELRKIISSDELNNYKNIQIIGLMAMATNTQDIGQIKKEFKIVNVLFEEFKSTKKSNLTISELSIGMSSDYKIAVEEGSTMIRVGSAIFGNRNYNQSQVQ